MVRAKGHFLTTKGLSGHDLRNANLQNGILRELRRRLEFLRRVFPQEQNPQAVYPPQSAAEFLKQRFLGAPL